MMTILRRRVACKICILKLNVTALPWSKNVSGPLLCYFKSDFTTIDRNDHYIEMMCHYLAHCFGSLRSILHYTKK